jgi:XTP/dITP diphosphohydrolase
MKDTREVFLVTGNQGKLREVKAILAPFGIQVRGIGEVAHIGEIEETGKSYAENALLKARRGFEVAKKIVLAEDSGLEVEYLQGAPGIYSARFCGLDSAEARNAKILELLQNAPPEERKARFVCVVALVWGGGERLFEGVCEGFIADKASGRGGFGYDPIFIFPPYQKTFAELGENFKNRFSHRALAFRKCAEFLLQNVFEG